MSGNKLQIAVGVPSLPLLKDKKYVRPQHNKENVLRHDLDDIMVSLVQPRLDKCCPRRSQSLMPRSIALKIATSAVEVPAEAKEMKALKAELRQYLDKMGQQSRGKEDDYTEFLRLAGESQDYLEYYIKTHFKYAGNEVPDYRLAGKAVLLSLLKGHYPVLTAAGNSSEVANRLLLAMEVNPLNDFHLVSWQAFSTFRRMMSLRHTSAQGRKFLLRYLTLGGEPIGQ